VSLEYQHYSRTSPLLTGCAVIEGMNRLENLSDSEKI